MLKILVLVSSLNIGDLSHKDALLSNITSPHSETIIDASSTNAEQQYLDFIRAVPEDEKFVTLAIGMHGQDLLYSLGHELHKKNNYVVLGIHQYTDKVGELAKNNIIDHIALPESSLSYRAKLSIENINQSLLFAVPTINPSVSELESSFSSWNHPDKPDLAKKYIIVTLPGDAPISNERKSDDVVAEDSGQVIRRFSIDSAMELFIDIKQLWEDNGREHIIILQNGPRTGKYDETGVVVCPHQWSEDPMSDFSVDYISKSFVENLEGAEIPYKFFNFTFKDGKPLSVYKPLLYAAISNENNYFITPGESVSALGQIPYYIPGNRNIVFIADSMNEDSMSVFRSACEREYLSYFSKDNNVTLTGRSTLRTDNDAKKFANDILVNLNPEPKKALER